MLRRSFAVIVGLALAVSVMLPGFATAAPNQKANQLLVTAPASVATDESFTVKVTDKAGGQVVEGAGVYLSSRYAPLALDVADKSAKTAQKTPLGTTGADGTLNVTVKESGSYFILAEKVDYSQGFSAITVKGLVVEISFTVDKPVYLQEQPVTMTLTNGLTTSMTLPSGAPWTVTRPNGDAVFTPVATTVLVEVKAGEARSICRYISHVKRFHSCQV